jgi:hypothetical protein
LRLKPDPTVRQLINEYLEALKRRKAIENAPKTPSKSFEIPPHEGMAQWVNSIKQYKEKEKDPRIKAFIDQFNDDFNDFNNDFNNDFKGETLENEIERVNQLIRELDGIKDEDTQKYAAIAFAAVQDYIAQNMAAIAVAAASLIGNSLVINSNEPLPPGPPLGPSPPPPSGPPSGPPLGSSSALSVPPGPPSKQAPPRYNSSEISPTNSDTLKAAQIASQISEKKELAEVERLKQQRLAEVEQLVKKRLNNAMASSKKRNIDEESNFLQLFSNIGCLYNK